MLIHPWDASTDPDEWQAFVAAHAFGVLTTLGRLDGWPVTVPTQFVLATSDRVDLHLARPNPLFKAVRDDDRAVLVIAGDWAYVPSRWKALDGEDPAMGIPTTYYAAVELRGRLTVVDDPALLTEILRRQLADTQPGMAVADPSAHGRTLAGIRGVQLTIEAVRAKFKYGGNVDDAHRAAVREHLAERAGPGDGAVIGHLDRRTPARAPAPAPGHN